MINPVDWKPADGMMLELNAEKAIREIGNNIAVIAGPGAGKTELLAQKADFLLRTGLCPYPRRILAVSFKIDAAKNLKDRVRLRCGAQLAARFDSFTFHAFAKQLVDNYRIALCEPLNSDYSIGPGKSSPPASITFDDLVSLSIELLEENYYTCSGLQQTYSHVFLDEFQDATEAQYSLVKEAFEDSESVLTAVADSKQRIMAWAGAMDRILQTYTDDFSAEALTLFQNYRSAPKLRRMQNRMIQLMEPESAIDPTDIQGEEGLIEVLHFSNANAEAACLAERISTWLKRGVSPSQIAVLVRQQSELFAGALTDSLSSKGIASRNEQKRQDLTAEPVVTLVLDFLRVIACQSQPSAYERLMRIALLGVLSDEASDRRSSQIQHFLAEQRCYVRSASFEPSDILSWERIIDKFLELITEPVLVGLSTTYQQGLRMRELLKETTESLQEELTVDGNICNALDRLSEINAVRILTIHKAKGLEFEKVIILGVENESFWMKKKSDIDELRRVFFVGISRAKHELLLTYTDLRPKPNAFQGLWKDHRTPQKEFLSYANQSI
ncbi:MAG: ATP-dependent helicase [Propionibacteriaceae bacterium]|jgi:superfamily I DNA/RNA helicase|nr:ATP-dependent helicase [Propionibacteriaceae bacterium]